MQIKYCSVGSIIVTASDFRKNIFGKESMVSHTGLEKGISTLTGRIRMGSLHAAFLAVKLAWMPKRPGKCGCLWCADAAVGKRWIIFFMGRTGKQRGKNGSVSSKSGR